MAFDCLLPADAGKLTQLHRHTVLSLSRYSRMRSRSLLVLSSPGCSVFDTMALHLSAVSYEKPSFLRITMMSSNSVSRNYLCR